MQDRLSAIEVDEDEWESLHKRLKRRGQSYKRIPRPDGSLLVITQAEDDQSEPLPDDDEQLVELVEELLKEAPEGKRVTGSKGFGGSWAGAHAQNKKKEWQIFSVSLDVIKRGAQDFAEGLQIKAELLTLGVEHPNNGAISLAALDDEAEPFLERLEREMSK